ncbi:unnamed protein product [Cunninghamella blakesleeana]
MATTSLSTQSKTSERIHFSTPISPSYSIKQQQTTENKDNSFSELLKSYNGPGKIARLGQSGRIQKDCGDWAHDIEIPNNETLQQQNINSQKQQAINKISDNNNNKNIDSDLLLFDDDDDGDDFSKENHPLKKKRSVLNNKNSNSSGCKNNKNNQEQKSSLPSTHYHHQQQWFEEYDNEKFDDIDLPDDLSSLLLKKRLNNPTSKIPTTNIGTNKTEKAYQLPTHLRKIQCFKDDDDDDFTDGLGVINDETFKIKNINKKVKEQQSQQTENKLIRSKKSQQYISSSSSIPHSSISQNKKPSLYENKLQRLTAPTYSSRQRTIINNNNNNNNNNNSNNISTISSSASNSSSLYSLKNRKSDYNLRKEATNLHSGSQRSFLKNNHLLLASNSRSILQQQKNKQPLATKKHLLLPNSKTTTTPSPNLMTRPRGSCFNHYGNGTELDNLDDLPVWKRPNLYNYNRTTSINPQKKQDTSKPWRQNMSKRNLKLIKPNDQTLESKINEMKYDSKNKQWKGNEQVMKSFEEPNKKRPALIKNMMRSKTSKCSKAVSVGDMVFDQEQMKWSSSNGHEIDIFSHINDLFDDNIHSKSNNTTYNRRPSKSPLHPSSSLSPLFISSATNSASSLSPSSSLSFLKQTMLYSNNNTNHSRHLNHQVPIFYMSDEMKNYTQELEAEHKKRFRTWPLYEDDETIKNQYGHIVPQYAYILY